MPLYRRVPKLRGIAGGELGLKPWNPPQTWQHCLPLVFQQMSSLFLASLTLLHLILECAVPRTFEQAYLLVYKSSTP